jgi:hypothetical protein
MKKPRELFETELAEIREELLRLGVRPRESPQQSVAIQKELLEDWRQAGRYWLDRMQSELALWGELGSKLATTRSAREAFTIRGASDLLLLDRRSARSALPIRADKMSGRAKNSAQANRHLLTVPVFSCFEAGEKGSLGKVGAGSEFLGLPELGRLV